MGIMSKNIGTYVGIDEIALSKGELHTVLINKAAKGGREIIDIIKGKEARR